MFDQWKILSEYWIKFHHIFEKKKINIFFLNKYNLHRIYGSQEFQNGIYKLKTTNLPEFNSDLYVLGVSIFKTTNTFSLSKTEIYIYFDFQNIIPSTSASTLKKGLSTKTTHQLGPENPRPFAVLSEHHVRENIILPYIPDHEKYMFGAEYEKKMCELINYYLELNTHDQLCYVGDPKGSFAPVLQNEFCLLKPITTVIPGHIHYQESPNHRMLPFK